MYVYVYLHACMCVFVYVYVHVCRCMSTRSGMPISAELHAPVAFCARMDRLVRADM